MGGVPYGMNTHRYFVSDTHKQVRDNYLTCLSILDKYADFKSVDAILEYHEFKEIIKDGLICNIPHEVTKIIHNINEIKRDCDRVRKKWSKIPVDLINMVLEYYHDYYIFKEYETLLNDYGAFCSSNHFPYCSANSRYAIPTVVPYWEGYPTGCSIQ